jgi:hypothetical protein
MDFAKAFDKVPHRRLLYKLNYYTIMLGFDGHVYDAVVREQPELTVCQVIREVVNVDQEQDGTQDCSLRNTRCDRHSR